MSGYLKPGCFFILLKNCVPDKKSYGMTSVTHPSAFAAVVSDLVLEMDIQFVVRKTLKCLRLDTHFKSSTSTPS